VPALVTDHISSLASSQIPVAAVKQSLPSRPIVNGIKKRDRDRLHPVGNLVAVVANPSYLDFGQFCKTLYILLISIEELA
jgi:hypothetical protein